MKPQTEELKRIYTRQMCADENDFVFAIKECKRIADSWGWTPALIRRAVSLDNGLKKLKSTSQLQENILDKINESRLNEMSLNSLSKELKKPSIAVFVAAQVLVKKGILKTRVDRHSRYAPTIFMMA